MQSAPGPAWSASADVGMLAEELDPATRSAHRLASASGPRARHRRFRPERARSPSRFGKIAGVPTIGRDEFMTRSGCPVLLVDLNGRLGVRKEFRNRGRFVQELEALLHLEARTARSRG